MIQNGANAPFLLPFCKKNDILLGISADYICVAVFLLFFMIQSTIAAISTAPAAGGVAIIRVSGPQSLSIAQKMFTPSGKTGVINFAPNRMYPGHILCDGFEDYGMCVYFKAPRSFTGEDVVELHCHGGVEISRAVLKAALSRGARMAEAGEFTKRAFLNGKLSLASAEGLIDMINAQSSAELRAGSMLYSEKLTRAVRELQGELKDILAGIAADIDYPEEDIAATDLGDVAARLRAVAAKIGERESSYSKGKKIKSGVLAALCGAPNAGKSSLLNALLGYDKAIVSPVAGTTRDAVEGTIQLGGVACNLVDTAGLREGAGEVEAIGISMAKRIVRSADIILYVCEGGYVPLEGVGEDDGRLIKIFNKCDISPAVPQGFDIVVSAKTGENIDKLKSLMQQKAIGPGGLEGAFITEERHYDALCRAHKSLAAAIAAADKFPLDALSLDITAAWSALGEITGETANEDIISQVFAKFCVGK